MARFKDCLLKCQKSAADMLMQLHRCQATWRCVGVAMVTLLMLVPNVPMLLKVFLPASIAGALQGKGPA